MAVRDASSGVQRGPRAGVAADGRPGGRGMLRGHESATAGRVDVGGDGQHAGVDFDSNDARGAVQRPCRRNGGGEEDSGKHVLLRPGQRLRIALGADFTPVEMSVDGVLDPVAASGGYGTGQPSSTVLTAAGPGELSLSSSTDFPCLHESPPCSMPQREWQLSVTVAAG